MSENPTDPATPATETGEKMIPLSAVELLIAWAHREIVEHRSDHVLDHVYDVTANALGRPSSHDLRHDGLESLAQEILRRHA